MSAQTVDVCKKECGKIWHRKPSPGHFNGIIVTIAHTAHVSAALQTRYIRFLHVAFDVKGEKFVAGDHMGNIYSFDVSRNRFSVVQRLGSPCTALAFSLRRQTEFLVALADHSLKCIDTESKELVAWMKGHESSVHHISVHASGRYALTSSQDTSQLWDLDTFTRKRKLNIKEDVGIVKVFFMPLSNTILTCLKDDSIFAWGWDADTLSCKYQFPIPPGRPPNYKAFACTKDGRVLAAGGKSRFIHIWSLESRQIQRIIQMPAKVTCVKQMDFLNESFDRGNGQILGVLSQDGIMRFINTDSCKLLFDIGCLENKIYNCAVSPVGRHVVAVTERGTIDLYDVAALYEDINRPPPPLVTVLESNQMHEKTQSSDNTSSSSRRLLTAPRRGPRRKENIPPSQFGDVTDDTSLPGGLDKDRLVAILKGFGEYPSKYRLFIWRSLLQLPENHAAYAALVDKGTHQAYSLLHQHYPIKSRKLLRVLQRCLSALGHWSPIFGETDYLPMLAFPFVQLVQNNQLVCFEIIASILVNWCQHWFEYFPNPPINVLSMVENMLAHHDRELLQHYVTVGVTSQVYAWPLLETLFSEVLTKDEWLILWDHVFSNHPAFLLVVVVAYNISSRGPLIHSTELDDFKYFFHHRNAVDLKHVIKEAYKINGATPSQIHPKNMLEPVQPLTRGQYPVFNKYPKFIVDYQVQERDRLRQEELDYVKQRQVNLQLQEEVVRHRNAEEAWYRQQKLLLDAEEKRRQLIQDEEQKIIDQRTRLQAMNREVKMKELQLLDAARRKYMGFQQKQKEVDLRRLDDELGRKTRMRTTETQSAIDNAELRNMELQVQRRMFEQELERASAEASLKYRAANGAHHQSQEVEDRIIGAMTHAASSDGDQMRKDVQQRLSTTEQRDVQADKLNQAELRHQLDDLHKERELLRISRLHKTNMDLENQIHGLVKRLDSAKLVAAKNAERERDELEEAVTRSSQRRLDLLYGTTEPYHLAADAGTDQFERLRDVRDVRDEVRLSGGRAGSLSCSDEEEDEPASDIASQISLERNRDTLDQEESQLLHEVCRIRHRLAREGRVNKRPA